jgi:hypothetical protein
MPWAVESWTVDYIAESRVEAWKAQIPALQEQVDALFNERLELKKKAKAALLAFVGTPSDRVYKYVEKNLPILSKFNVESNFNERVVRQIAAHKEKKAKEEREAKLKADADNLQTSAVAWLLLRGKKLGEDFTIQSAVHTANEISFEEECAKRKESGGYIDFCGQNCDGPCEGWDMESRRCDCGNRRVSWCSDRHSFLEPYVYAEAY